MDVCYALPQCKAFAFSYTPSRPVLRVRARTCDMHTRTIPVAPTSHACAREHWTCSAGLSIASLPALHALPLTASCRRLQVSEMLVRRCVECWRPFQGGRDICGSKCSMMVQVWMGKALASNDMKQMSKLSVALLRSPCERMHVAAVLIGSQRVQGTGQAGGHGGVRARGICKPLSRVGPGLRPLSVLCFRHIRASPILCMR